MLVSSPSPRSTPAGPRLRKAALAAALFLWVQAPALAQSEPPFSLQGHLGVGEVSGFLGQGGPQPAGGLWLGIDLSDRFEGFWGLDYMAFPGQEIFVPLTPSKDDSRTYMYVQPTDDLSLTIDTRWYTSPKYDSFHRRFNTVPYLMGGIGMDMVVDQPGRPPGGNFFSLFSTPFDALFCVNLGAGMDFPLGRGDHWIFYAEGLDHFIAWQGLTQVFLFRGGIRIMVDSAHLDPFR
jgi:hypothetical protein